MKNDNRTNYIDRFNVPHGDWCRIIGMALDAWNEERERANAIPLFYDHPETLKELCDCIIIKRN